MEIKTKIYVKCILILILLSICIALFINRENTTCDKCIIEFSSKSVGVQNLFSIPVLDIYDDFLNGNCSVFKNSMGYIQNG